MTDPQNAPDSRAEAIAAAQEAAGHFCSASDPFAPDQQMNTAQMLGEPILQPQQQA